MKFVLSQLNVTVGDILLNRKKIINYIEKAADKEAEPVVCGDGCLYLYGSVNLLGLIKNVRCL